MAVKCCQGFLFFSEECRQTALLKPRPSMVFSRAVDPKELETAEGQVRFRILREMFRALAAHSGWIHTVSNWALGTTGVYVGLVVSNLDKLQPHLVSGWQVPVLWCAAISAVIGIGIQIAAGFIQFAIPIEQHIFSFITDIFQNPAKFGIAKNMQDAQSPQRLIDPVLDEFIQSRPWAWGEFAKYIKEQGERDVVYVTKISASCAQMMFVFLVLQYILLGVAIFWPLALVR